MHVYHFQAISLTLNYLKVLLNWACFISWVSYYVCLLHCLYLI